MSGIPKQRDLTCMSFVKRLRTRRNFSKMKGATLTSAKSKCTKQLGLPRSERVNAKCFFSLEFIKALTPVLAFVGNELSNPH